MKTHNTLYFLADQVGRLLKEHGLMLATAESCTGGQIAEAITTIAGSSNWFERGFVTYSNAAKTEMLAVKKITLEKMGAVSAEVAQEMAEGALKLSQAQVSIAVTGIAGPEGGSAEKPIGTVWLAWAQKDKPTQTELKHFTGDRNTIRTMTTTFALQKLVEILQKSA